jgi:hypothetical protein
VTRSTLDAVTAEEGDAPQERDGRGRLLVGGDLDACQPGRIIDADVHVLPADVALALSGGVGLRAIALRAPLTVDAMAGVQSGIRASFVTSTCSSSPACRR